MAKKSVWIEKRKKKKVLQGNICIEDLQNKNTEFENQVKEQQKHLNQNNKQTLQVEIQDKGQKRQKIAQKGRNAGLQIFSIEDRLKEPSRQRIKHLKNQNKDSNIKNQNTIVQHKKSIQQQQQQQPPDQVVGKQTYNDIEQENSQSPPTHSLRQRSQVKEVKLQQQKKVSFANKKDTQTSKEQSMNMSTQGLTGVQKHYESTVTTTIPEGGHQQQWVNEDGQNEKAPNKYLNKSSDSFLQDVSNKYIQQNKIITPAKRDLDISKEAQKLFQNSLQKSWNQVQFNSESQEDQNQYQKYDAQNFKDFEVVAKAMQLPQKMTQKFMEQQKQNCKDKVELMKWYDEKLDQNIEEWDNALNPILKKLEDLDATQAVQRAFLEKNKFQGESLIEVLAKHLHKNQENLYKNQQLQNNHSKTSRDQYLQLQQEVQSMFDKFQKQFTTLNKQSVENGAQTSEPAPKQMHSIQIQCNKPHKVLSYMGRQMCPEGISILSGFSTPIQTPLKSKNKTIQQDQNGFDKGMFEEQAYTQSVNKPKARVDCSTQVSNIPTPGNNQQQKVILKEQNQIANNQGYGNTVQDIAKQQYSIQQQEKDVDDDEQQQQQNQNQNRLYDNMTTQQDTPTKDTNLLHKKGSPKVPIIPRKSNSQQSSLERNSKLAQEATSKQDSGQIAQDEFQPDQQDGQSFIQGQVDEYDLQNINIQPLKLQDTSTLFKFQLSSYMPSSTITESADQASATSSHQIHNLNATSDQLSDPNKLPHQMQYKQRQTDQCQVVQIASCEDDMQEDKNIQDQQQSIASGMQKEQYVTFQAVSFGKIDPMKFDKLRFKDNQKILKDQVPIFIQELQKYLRNFYNDPIKNALQIPQQITETHVDQMELDSIIKKAKHINRDLYNNAQLL